MYQAGPHPGEILRDTEKQRLSPVCLVRKVSRYKVDDDSALSTPETDGEVFKMRLPYSGTAYIYRSALEERAEYTIVVPLPQGEWAQVRDAIRSICFTRPEWPCITGSLTEDFLSSINNLSPRAWDSKRIQKVGASYTPKVDGERVYVLLFRGMMHVFSKGKGNNHVGCKPLERQLGFDGPVVMNAENTVSHGMFLIDMLTWANGETAPRERDCNWFVQEAERVKGVVGDTGVRVKPYTSYLLQAEKISRCCPYPTYGVIAMWPGTTTSRKMKLEKSIGLVVSEGAPLAHRMGM